MRQCFGSKRPEVSLQPSSDRAGEVDEHRETAERLNKQRQRAADLLAQYIPLIKERQKELEEHTRCDNGARGESLTCAKQLDAIELSALLRLKHSLKKYEQAQEDVQASLSTWPTIDASFVQQAESAGYINKILGPISELVRIAEDCEKCAREVGCQSDRGSSVASLVAPSSNSAECVDENEEIAGRLNQQRQRSSEILDLYVPRIRARYEELKVQCEDPQAPAKLSAGVEESNAMTVLFRMRVTVGLKKYERAQDEIRASYSSCPVIDGNFVQQAKAIGHLHKIEAPLSDLAHIAEDCETCARELHCHLDSE